VRDSLARAAEATIADAKLRDYVLNPASERGSHKARLFASILGFTQDNAEALRDAILQALPGAPAVPRLIDEHGARFQVDVEVTGPKGRGVIRTGWIIRKPGAAPSFITAVVLKEKAK